jgi:hypothetical protein
VKSEGSFVSVAKVAFEASLFLLQHFFTDELHLTFQYPIMAFPSVFGCVRYWPKKHS